MKLLAPLDLTGNEVQNARLQNLGADPGGLGAGDKGRTWYNSSGNVAKIWNGSSADALTNLVDSVVAGSALLSANTVNKVVTVDANAATANTPNTLVTRDASGNFSAGTITAALTGLASNASQLGGQSLAQVRDFSQTTGTRPTSAISGFDTQVRTSTLNQMAPPTAALDVNAQRITNAADPTTPQDLATKNYVDSVVSGLDPKASVQLATTAALAANAYSNGASGVGATLTASGNGVMAAIDGVTPTAGMRVLVKNEATTARNGIYTVTSVGSVGTPYVLTRATDADVAAEVTGGMFTFVEQGTTNGSTGWALTGTGAFVIGTTAQVFIQFSSAGAYTAGNGLALAGNSFSVVGTANRISVSGAGVDISAAYVGQTSITTLGTIATGVWNGTAVPIANGGTGATTAAAARTNLGVVAKVAGLIPAGASYVFTHNLNTLDVVVALVEVATGKLVQADYTATSVNAVTIDFGAAVAASAYRVIVIG
jgi:hypothetical protein